MAKRTVITIGREFGSGGREIGKKLADELGIAFYDKELLEIAAQESGICRELFESNDEKPVSSLLYSLSVNPYSVGNIAGASNIPLTQKLFLAQFETIQKLAKKSDCVIVGRCADYALRGDPDCINVFIHAPLGYRVARIKELHELSSNEAKDLIVKTDKKRAAYYNAYSDKKWGETANYHLAIDSSVIGGDNAVELIKQFAGMRQDAR
ncbi:MULTISPECIES: cytidylate kinase-like family protein [Anaerotruncus]|uniref:cytidylate kinase-like family protein n=1 Tax=Anaerotruncus TaxID=244127 RepID=UPI000835389C|nr:MULTISPECIES: cytidylate kinase-like family protein [Anaerotruncus]RGX54516.1 cytidylate kinase-like family protein [Anaerotruncus sp. AF02-27]